MQKWSIDQPPQGADIPLAIRYQVQEPMDGHEQKRQRRQQKEVVHRLRLTLAWTFTHTVLRKFQNNMLEAASAKWPSVPGQRLQTEDPFLYAVVWACALDVHESPTFLVIPIDAHSIKLLRVGTHSTMCRAVVVLSNHYRAWHFFDAWRITPSLKLAPEAQMYGEPPVVDPSPERDQWDVEEERTVAGQKEHYSSRQETPKDKQFEISKAALDALKDLDEGLRTQLGGKECIDAPEEATLNRILSHCRCDSRMAFRKNNIWHSAKYAVDMKGC